MAKEQKEEKNKGPVFESRLGNIRVSVWLNWNGDDYWFNTVICRRFKDGDEWRDVNTYNGLADLALVGEAQRLARDYIAAQELAEQDHLQRVAPELRPWNQ